MDQMESKMVLPGDEIAVAEEFEPGEGTYEKNGLVFAATPGVLILDAANRVARVRAFNPPARRAHGTTEARGRLRRLEALCARDRTRRWEGRGETSGASERGSRSRWTRPRSGRGARSVPRPRRGSRSRRTRSWRPRGKGPRPRTTSVKPSQMP